MTIRANIASLLTPEQIEKVQFRTTLAGNYNASDVDNFLERYACDTYKYREMIDVYCYEIEKRDKELEACKKKLADYQTQDNQQQITEALADRVADKVISRLGEVI